MNKLMFLFVFSVLSIAGKEIVSAKNSTSLNSPNGKISVAIKINDIITYSVIHDKDTVLVECELSMILDNGNVFGKNPKLLKKKIRSISQEITTPVYKRSKINDDFNELSLHFKGGYNIIFRAYNDGVAYRFVSELKGSYAVSDEKAEFRFPSDCKLFVNYVRKPAGPFENQYMNCFENFYTHTKLSEWTENRLALCPILAESVNGKKVCIIEADLINYPGMFIYPASTANSLKGVYATYPKEIVQGGHNELQGMVKSRENHIASYNGPTKFPWRAVIVSGSDSELADNDMVYKLSTPSQGDYSWVKPGKVAWDWWNNWSLYDVDFRAGINNETYKYYIDFASTFGIEYVILDEGWAVNKKADLFQVVPSIDMRELSDYAKNKNVGLILWAGYYAFNRDMEAICKHYSEMGIKGFKIDFMDRDDQPMVDFHRRAAEMAAKYKLLVDFHGTYKPTGLQRTYPNVINFEGVNGLEQLKWASAELDQVTYDVTMPFIRMIAGPIDYTQGAMRNASKSNYRGIYSEPMSQGTRCRQLAEYVVFESPLNMLCDSPSNYMREKECTEFIARIPTVWDQTVALMGEVGEYISMARRSNDKWYVGGMTNWKARSIELDLSFIGDGEFMGELFKDGVNADRVGRDYKKTMIDIPSDRKLKIGMAPGGGFALTILPK